VSAAQPGSYDGGYSRGRSSWAALWHGIYRWAASRDLDRIDVSVLAALHSLYGLGLWLLPPSLNRSYAFEVLFDGELLGVPFRLWWAAAYTASGVLLSLVCWRPNSWPLQHAAWGVAVPLMAMWTAGLAIVLPSGRGNLLGVLVFAAIGFWHLTTAVRMWKRTS
jgi:hypothetical protein